MKLKYINILILFIFLLSLSGCDLLEKVSSKNIITVIGIDKTGSFIRREDEKKKNLISEIVFEILKEKANIQENDKILGIKTTELRKTLGGGKVEGAERVIICPISYRGESGVRLFLICNDNPVSILKNPKFSNKDKLKNSIFPSNEEPLSRTDFIQFFKELKAIYEDMDRTRLKVNYILITDGLPDPSGMERRPSPEITSQYLISKYGETYIKELKKLLPDNVRFVFLGVDSNILEFWNYVLNGVKGKDEKDIQIQYVTSSLEQITREKIKEISNPYK